MRTLRRNEGFTLVEMMMAMLIMTVGLLGLLQSIMVAYDVKARASRREQSFRLAEQKLNDLALKPYDNISAQYKPYTSVHPFTVTQESTVIGNTKRIKVEVKWPAKGVLLHHEIFTMKERDSR